MAKTIDDYKKDYAAARAAGDAAGMQAANDGANAIRASQGQAAEYATEDIAKIASQGKSTAKTTTSTPAKNVTPAAGGATTDSVSAVTPAKTPDTFAGSATSVGVHTGDQEAIRAQMNANSQAWHTADAATKQLLEAQNKELAAQLGGSVKFDPTTGYWSGAASAPETEVPEIEVPENAAPRVDPTDLQSLLNQWREAAIAQNNGKIDYGVTKAVLELERALEDAQKDFKEQQESITRDEMQSRDNSALYAEARGDKGGIGHEQYNSIMNTAAQNRLAVQQAQTKLSTDTQRQIADLRAQGEFEKADALLSTAQTYLSQLIALEQWAAEYNLSVDQFNESVRQWEAEFKTALNQYNDSLAMAEADLTGLYKGSPTLQAQQLANEQLVSSGETLLAYGILPSTEQLAAMGLTTAQAQQIISAYQLEQAAKAAGEGGGPGTDGSAVPVEDLSRAELYQHLYDEGYTNRQQSSVKDYLMSMGMTATEAATAAAAYCTEQYNLLKAKEPEAQAGYNEANFSAAMKVIMTTLAGGDVAGAESALNALLPKLSTEQQQRALDAVGKYVDVQEE